MTKFLQEVRTKNEALWVVQWLTQTNPRWRRPPSLILEKYQYSGLEKAICTIFHGKMHHGHADMTAWPKVETGSSPFAWRYQMKVWRISASISVTITDIWTKFGTKHKYHTINTPEWSNSHNLKLQDGGCRHLWFLGYMKRKMSISPDWIKISASNFTG